MENVTKVNNPLIALVKKRKKNKKEKKKEKAENINKELNWGNKTSTYVTKKNKPLRCNCCLRLREKSIKYNRFYCSC